MHGAVRSAPLAAQLVERVDERDAARCVAATALGPQVDDEVGHDLAPASSPARACTCRSLRARAISCCVWTARRWSRSAAPAVGLADRDELQLAHHVVEVELQLDELARAAPPAGAPRAAVAARAAVPGRGRSPARLPRRPRTTPPCRCVLRAGAEPLAQRLDQVEAAARGGVDVVALRRPAPPGRRRSPRCARRRPSTASGPVTVSSQLVPAWSTALVTSSLTSRHTESTSSRLAPQRSNVRAQNRRAAPTLDGSACEHDAFVHRPCRLLAARLVGR